MSLCFFSGILISSGMWFRPEAKLYILLFAVLILFFLPANFNQHFKEKFAALGFLVGIQYLTSPVSPHEIPGLSLVAGLMTPFDSQIGIIRSVYDWGYLFLDEYISANAAIQGNFSGVLSGLPVAHQLLLKYLIFCPADVIIRVLGAAIKISQLSFSTLLSPPGLMNPFLLGLYSWRGALLTWLGSFSLAFCALAWCLIIYRNARIATFCTLFLLFAASYTSIQFFGRNYFYLEFVGWWLFG